MRPSTHLSTSLTSSTLRVAAMVASLAGAVAGAGLVAGCGDRAFGPGEPLADPQPPRGREPAPPPVEDPEPEPGPERDPSPLPDPLGCQALDEQACSQRGDCVADYCEDCTALRPFFVGCRASSKPTTPCPPPRPECSPCRGLDEASCAAANCEAFYCDGCDGPAFRGCGAPGDPAPSCGRISCPEPCEQLDELACAERPDCQRRYRSEICPAACESSPCCSQFAGCGRADAASCQPSPTCDVHPSPPCEPPLVAAAGDDCTPVCVFPEDCD